MILPQNVSDPEPVEDKTSEEQKDKKAPEQQPYVSKSSSIVSTHVWSLSLLLFLALRLLVWKLVLNSSASYSFSDMFGDAVVASDEQTQENAS